MVDGDLWGLSAGGLGLVADGSITGLSLSGLGIVSDRSITGVTLAGLAIVADDRLAGLGVTAGRIVADNTRGATVAGWLRTWEMRGLAISPYTQIKGQQRGLAIGIFNTADELHGLQIGVLNRAKNNRGIAQWLPLFNFHK